MFNFLGGLSNFMNTTPNIASMGFSPSMATPNLGDYSAMTSYFRTALGPSGLLGVGDPNIAASITGNVSGTLGAGMGQDLTSRVPQYRTVYEREPVYEYDHLTAFDYHFEQGSINQHTDVRTSFTPVQRDPVIINFDGDGSVGVTGKDSSSEIIADNTTTSTATDGNGTTTTTTRNWTTRDNWNNKIDFDVNADGKMDRTEWLAKGTKDAFLVVDVNNDGKIDGRELMNETGVDGKQDKYKSGWEKVRDLGDANKDGIIEGDELKKFKVWNDANGDGKMDSGEMRTLEESGVVKMNTLTGETIRRRITAYRAVPKQQVAGYFELNVFGSNSSSNVGLNFIPSGGGAATADLMSGAGGYPNFAEFNGLSSYLWATRPPVTLPDGTIVPDHDQKQPANDGSSVIQYT